MSKKKFYCKECETIRIIETNGIIMCPNCEGYALKYIKEVQKFLKDKEAKSNE